MRVIGYEKNYGVDAGTTPTDKGLVPETNQCAYLFGAYEGLPVPG
jgi:hypothetical protein